VAFARLSSGSRSSRHSRCRCSVGEEAGERRGRDRGEPAASEIKADITIGRNDEYLSGGMIFMAIS